MIYPQTEVDWNAHERMKQYLQFGMKDSLSKWVMNFEGLEAQGSGAKSKTAFKFGEKLGYHKSKISELINYFEDLRKTLNTGQIKEDFIDQIDKILSLARRAQKNAEAEMAKNGGKDFISYSKINNQKDATSYRNVIKELNDALMVLTTLTAEQTAGLAFEQAIATMDDSLAQTIAGVGYGVVKDTLVTGAKRETITFDGNFDKFMRRYKDSVEVHTEDADVKVSVEGNGAATMQTVFKTDVQLTYNGEKYSVSAKNYSLKNDNRIGLVSSFSMDSGLMRNIGADATNHALNLIFAHGSEDGVRATAHTYIKTILAVEGLTGVSQSRGGSDLLVINDRSRRKVYVLRMTDIVGDKEKFLKLCSFSDYKDFEEGGADKYNIWEDAKEHGNDIWLASKHRVDQLLTRIHAQKIKISLNVRNWRK